VITPVFEEFHRVLHQNIFGHGFAHAAVHVCIQPVVTDVRLTGDGHLHLLLGRARLEAGERDVAGTRRVSLLIFSAL